MEMGTIRTKVSRSHSEIIAFLSLTFCNPNPTYGGECHGARYKIHFYCLAVEAGFYSDVVECLPVDPATWVRFPAGAGKIFSLYDNGAHRK